MTLGSTSQTNRGRRVCIVGPNHLANTPRIVKEADALAEAGFDVRVVFSQPHLEAVSQDEELTAFREWRHTSVRWSRENERIRWFLTGIRQHGLQRAPRSLWRIGSVVELAEGRVFPELAAAAAAEEADLYIGHYAEGLSAAAFAAKRWDAKLGFDAEDFHTGEGSPESQTARIDFIQRRYLPACAHLTAASTGIAECLAARYGVPTPVAVHNTFPWADREALDGRVQDRRGDLMSLYWCSQTIGLDRGIQDAIRAAGSLGGPVQIHLRGTVSPSVRADLMGIAADAGIADRLYFHPRVPPGELLSRSVEHDVGLALEQGDTLNRTICASNKMFFYLLAGLAVAATDVPGQRAVLGSLPHAAALYAPGDHRTLAQDLEYWRVNRDALKRAKKAALEAARDRWNWETESAKLVTQVDELLSRCAPTRARELATIR